MKPDTINRFMVGSRGDRVVIVLPPIMSISKEDAVNLAAWLVVMSDISRDDWEKFLTEIENS